MSAAKVLLFENKSLFYYYDLFLNSKKQRSENTFKNYKLWIEEFFNYKYKSEISKVELSQLENLIQSDIQEYVNYLLDNGNKPQTVDYKVKALKSFFGLLEVNEINVNMKMFNKIVLPVKNVQDHDSLTHEELESLFNYAKSQKQKSLEKYLLLKAFYVTAGRRNEMLNLTWEQIKKVKNIDNDYIYVFEYLRKGDKITQTPINEDFYNELLQLKDKSQTQSSKVFNVSEKTMYTLLDKWKVENNIDESRNVGLHSIRSSAATDAIEKGYSLKQVQDLLNHKNSATTMHYVKSSKNLKDKLSYKMTSNTVETIEDLSKEQLVNLIKKLNLDTEIMKAYNN